MKILLYLLFLPTVFGACRETKLSTLTSKQVLSDRGLYLDNNSQVRIFFNATESHPGQFVTELVVNSNSITIPKSISEGDYGDRTKSFVPQELDLIAKIYRPALENGDFYFEAPVLSPQLEVSNVTTALSWILRWGFGSDKVRISQEMFLNLANSVELLCLECRKKTNSATVDFILNNPELKNQVLRILQQQNQDLILSDINYAPPELIYVWSSPNLALNGFVAKEARETQSADIKLLLLNPKNSSQAIHPSSWDKTFNELTANYLMSDFLYQFTYEDKGKHQIKPIFDSVTNLINLNFEYNVTDVNRNPICDAVITLNFKANRTADKELMNYCRDLDPEDNSLNYALVSGPAGLTISSGGRVRWTPPQAADGLAYTKEVFFMVSDSKLGYAEVKMTLQVEADKIPVFTSVPSPLNFSEANTNTYTFQASDPDGDPIVLKIEPIQSINTEIPEGSGMLTNIVRTGGDGIYSFDWSFMPSWLQTTGSDKTVQVRLALFYDPLDPDLDSGLRLATQEVSLNITNTDDPPQWTVQPVELTVEEGVSMNMTFIGTAVDPSPDSTAVTYSMEINPVDQCNWTQNPGVVVNNAGSVYFDLEPAYNSPETCSFYLVATDAKGIRTLSNEFIVTVNDTNRPVVVKSNPTTFLTGLERKVQKIDMGEFFEDPDFTENDPRETAFGFSCLWDDNLDGIYDQACDFNSTANIKFLFNPSGFYAAWTPSATSAGTYQLRFTVTDKGGSSASHDFTLQIDQAPAEMDLYMAVTETGERITELTASEDGTVQVTLQARAATADAIDNYDFKVNPVQCVVIGNHLCDPTMVTITGSNTSLGDTDFVFNIKTDFDDGDSPLPGNSRSYNLRFKVEKMDDPNIYTEFYLALTVTNKNRAPTGIGLSDGSNGCIGSPANSTTDSFVVCVDASKDSKVGTTWTKTYSSTLSGVDPDGANDLFSFNWTTSLPPGTITGNSWSFKLPSCISKGTSTVYRYFQLEVADGRGGTIQREVTLKILRAQPAGLCMQ